MQAPQAKQSGTTFRFAMRPSMALQGLALMHCLQLVHRAEFFRTAKRLMRSKSQVTRPAGQMNWQKGRYNNRLVTRTSDTTAVR
jgi:hypothetical protein